MRVLFFAALLVLLPTGNVESAISSVQGCPVRARIWTGFADAERHLESLFLQAGLSEIAGLRLSRRQETSDQVEARISELIERTEKPAALNLQRGDAYFLLREFDMASEDYSGAIDLNPGLDEAWYGRGMARGRAGELDEAAADLGEYLRRRPDSSLGYTKRGVRPVWRGDFKSAEKDLREAVRLDPSHHKGYHNLALTHFLLDENQRTLEVVDRALRLHPRARESLLLKARVLTSLGRKAEAANRAESGEFLPEANWSERLEVQ